MEKINREKYYLVIETIKHDGQKLARFEDENEVTHFVWDNRFDGDIYWDEHNGYVFGDGTEVMSLPQADIEE
jgi:hypothetical protein